MNEKRKPGRPKKTDSQANRKKDRHTKPRLAFHLPVELLDAFKAMASKNRRSITSELILAMESALKANGHDVPQL
jgi:Arc-like DNA binding domain